MLTHAELKGKMLAKRKVRKAYEALKDEFTALDSLLKARVDSGLTQAEIARRMGTHAPAIARLEASMSKPRHSPTVETLRKYAAACGKKLEIRLI